MGTFLAHSPACVGPAPFSSSLDTSPIAPRALSSSTASRAFTSPVAQFTSPSADFARPPSVIIPAGAEVAIVIEPTTYTVIGYGGFTLNLARRLVGVDGTGVLADWRVQCDAPTLLTHDDPLNAPDPEVMRRLPLKTYTEALRGLSQILARQYLVFHNRDAVLEALRLSLPLDRTTDIGQNMLIRNSALCVMAHVGAVSAALFWISMCCGDRISEHRCRMTSSIAREVFCNCSIAFLTRSRARRRIR